MTDILTLVFKTFEAQSGSINEEISLTSARSVLVVGDHDLSRSILLLAAVTAASEWGLRVIFFTKNQIQNLPASLQKRVPRLNPESLKKIKFCYPRNLEELLVQVAGLHESMHTSPFTPALIIVDGLEGYLCSSTPSTSGGANSGAQSSTAHLSALLCDMASFLSQVLEKQVSNHAPCRLIASFQTYEPTEQKGVEPSPDPILEVLDRYFLTRCTLDQQSHYDPESDGLKQVWNIYLSCLGITRTCKNEDVEHPQAHNFQEWRLLLSPDGLMEFKKCPKSEQNEHVT